MDDPRFICRHGVFHAQCLWKVSTVAIGRSCCVEGIPFCQTAFERGALSSTFANCLSVVLQRHVGSLFVCPKSRQRVPTSTRNTGMECFGAHMGDRSRTTGWNEQDHTRIVWSSLLFVRNRQGRCHWLLRSQLPRSLCAGSIRILPFFGFEPEEAKNTGMILTIVSCKILEYNYRWIIFFPYKVGYRFLFRLELSFRIMQNLILCLARRSVETLCRQSAVDSQYLPGDVARSR